MNAAILRELADLVDQGHPCDAISVGAQVTIVCTNIASAARWEMRCPNGVLPETGAPVVVVMVPIYEVTP